MIENSHACLISEGESREGCRRGKIEVAKQQQIDHSECKGQKCEQRDGAENVWLCMVGFQMMWHEGFEVR